ncbi:hypothetical protein C942_02399 [Photobacterium marinum]|uniref:Knr4/Smi1-like domain-containing protein n=1 Tax=Photobacterium marinum TaxID=1056511 RepID=L8J717_9GAMM|nr:SMI1/KNR4 family protein [Photobacterium marinum]ELR64586.1 hypothetical protein C942_02399 [Photobacterium marinum]
MLKTMNDVGPKLSEFELDSLEKKLKTRLPKDYRDFLLQFNGGEPQEDTIDFDGDKINISGASIGYFYGLGTGSEDIQVCMELIGDIIPDGLIPFADTPEGNYFLISTRSDSENYIYYKDHEVEDTVDFSEQNNKLPESIVKVSSSFSDFINQLYDLND